jgi:hypothetical protein
MERTCRTNDIQELLSSVRAYLPPSNVPNARETDVGLRAYELYESKGRNDGADLDDWLEAERELRGCENL